MLRVRAITLVPVKRLQAEYFLLTALNDTAFVGVNRANTKSLNDVVGALRYDRVVVTLVGKAREC